MAHPLSAALSRAEQKTETSLTDAQRASGKYTKGTLDWKGLKIAVETPKGEIRTGTGKDGKRWFVEMPATYGELLRTEGRDGDPVDVYLGNDHASRKVFVVDQKNAESGRFDEHKCFLGFPDKRAVTATYEKAFSDGKARDRLGEITELSVEDFKHWLKAGDTKQPMSKQKPNREQALIQAYAPKGYATGGRVGYAEGGAPSDYSPSAIYHGLVNSLGDMYAGDLPTMDAKTRASIRNKSLAGRSLSYQEQQRLADIEAANAERSDRLGVPAGVMATELTGVPSIMRGGENVYRGVRERDPARVAGGTLEGILGAVPVSAVARPLAPLVAPFARTIPRFMATSVGASGLTAYADDAKAAERNAATMIASDPEVQAINADRQKALGDIERINKQHARSGPKTQEQALLPYQKELDRLNAALEKAQDRARAKYMDQASFREKYPGVPGAIYGAGLGAAAALPFMKNMAERGSDRFARRPAIEKATDAAENAFKGGLSDAETATAQELLRRKVDRWDASHSGFGSAAKYAGGMGTGAGLAFEASNFPEQFDLITNEPGHPAREKAIEQMNKGSYWRERATAALPGAGAGMLGVKLSKFAPTNTEFLDRAREVASRGAEPPLTERLLSYFNKSPATGPSERAMEQVRRYREAAGPAHGSKDAMMLEELLGSQSAKGAILPPPTSPVTRADPSLPVIPETARLGERVAAPMPLPSPGLSPESVPSLENAASKARVIMRVKDSRGRVNHHDEKGNFTSDPRKETLKKGKDNGKVPVESERARGGLVARTMALARRYATGGKVVPHGLMAGGTPGRADKLPISVPSGAYVLPADVVSAAGEGNTMAGAEALQKMLPPPSRHDAAASPVDIKISDGEIVVSPSQVAALGHGSLEEGHRMLDALVKQIRAQHIETLRSLPGPAQG